MNLKVSRPSWINCSADKLEICYETVAEPKNKATMFGIAEILSRLNNMYYRNGVSSLMILEERIKNFYIGIIFEIENPFHENINEMILYLLSGGIIDYWVKSNQKRRGIFKLDEFGPQVLTMEHLEVGFMICCFPLTLSFIVFLLEYVLHFFRSLKPFASSKLKRKNAKRKFKFYVRKNFLFVEK